MNKYRRRISGIQAIEYLNISGLVIDFVTSPVRTGNSFFATSLQAEVGVIKDMVMLREDKQQCIFTSDKCKKKTGLYTS